jgi:hypothetical protein
MTTADQYRQTAKTLREEALSLLNRAADRSGTTPPILISEMRAASYRLSVAAARLEVAADAVALVESAA